VISRRLPVLRSEKCHGLRGGRKYLQDCELHDEHKEYMIVDDENGTNENGGMRNFVRCDLSEGTANGHRPCRVKRVERNGWRCPCTVGRR
jgi:hypothetical protein